MSHDAQRNVDLIASQAQQDAAVSPKAIKDD